MTRYNDRSENEQLRRLFDAYEKTCFVIDAPGKEIHLRIGQQNLEADALLKSFGVTHAAFITAWNPGSKRLSVAENERRQQSMEEQIQSAGFRFLRGRGEGSDPSWEPEESSFIFGIARGLAIALSSQFGQIAMVWHETGQASVLISVSNCGEGHD